MIRKPVSPTLCLIALALFILWLIGPPLTFILMDPVIPPPF